MKYIFNLLYITTLTIMFGSCCKETEKDCTLENRLSISSEIIPMYEDKPSFSRINDEGNSFIEGDMIRLKLITPYANSHQTGENTYSSLADNFYILGMINGKWSTSGFIESYDIYGNGSLSTSAPNLPYLSQSTPYVFTASTWSSCQGYKIKENSWLVEYKNIFYSDQSTQDNYRSSDVLWAQTIMQTATDNVHLSFHHVMCSLIITLDNKTINANNTLQLRIEGMPDIDGREIIIGNKFSKEDIRYNTNFSSAKLNYSEDGNGKAIGVSEMNESNSDFRLKTFEEDKNGIYIPYKVSDTKYSIIIPPFTTDNSKIVIRSNEKKWEFPLTGTFEANNRYNLTLTLN